MPDMAHGEVSAPHSEPLHRGFDSGLQHLLNEQRQPHYKSTNGHVEVSYSEAIPWPDTVRISRHALRQCLQYRSEAQRRQALDDLIATTTTVNAPRTNDQPSGHHTPQDLDIIKSPQAVHKDVHSASQLIHNQQEDLSHILSTVPESLDKSSQDGGSDIHKSRNIQKPVASSLLASTNLVVESSDDARAEHTPTTSSDCPSTFDVAKRAPDSRPLSKSKTTALSLSTQFTSASLQSQRTLSDPKEHRNRVGSLLKFLSEKEGKFWDFTDEANEELDDIVSEVEDCLKHAALPVRVNRGFYMHGKHERSARPTVLLFGGTNNSRKIAKQRLQEEVVYKGSKFGHWKILTAERHPLMPRMEPLKETVLQTSSMLLIKYPQTESYSVQSTISQARCAIAGNVQIDNKDYLFTCAHAFEQTSSLQQLLSQSSEAPNDRYFDTDDDTASLETDSDHQDDESDASSEPDGDVIKPASRSNASNIWLESTWLDSWWPGTLTDTSTSPAPEDLANCRPSQTAHLSALQGEIQDKLEVETTEVSWPASVMTVSTGLDVLDYALIHNPSPGPQDRAFHDLSWWQGPTARSPGCLVSIRPNDRHELHGSFLRSCISTDVPDGQHYWIFWPLPSELDDTASYNGIQKGDSGSWVYGNGNVYGHVIAGDPQTGAALIVPSPTLYHDIFERYGRPRFGDHQVETQASSEFKPTVTDVEVNEPPLQELQRSQLDVWSAVPAPVNDPPAGVPHEGTGDSNVEESPELAGQELPIVAPAVGTESDISVIKPSVALDQGATSTTPETSMNVLTTVKSVPFDGDALGTPIEKVRPSSTVDPKSHLRSQLGTMLSPYSQLAPVSAQVLAMSKPHEDERSDGERHASNASSSEFESDCVSLDSDFWSYLLEGRDFEDFHPAERAEPSRIKRRIGHPMRNNPAVRGTQTPLKDGVIRKYEIPKPSALRGTRSWRYRGAYARNVRWEDDTESADSRHDSMAPSVRSAGSISEWHPSIKPP